MGTTECAWSDLFDDSERKALENGFFFTGFISILLGLWLNLSILLSKLSQNCSYKNLANFTTAACVRRIVPLINHLSIFKYIARLNGYESAGCEFFAFLETFLAVYEVEWLTHVCIERYVVAKYITNGWPMQQHHYSLFQSLCLFFASLYSLPPLVGVGRYGPDFSCTYCTFDMVLPESWKKYTVVAIFLLRSVKPAIVMVMMLSWARILENKFACSDETQKQVKFTKNIIIIALVNQLCWSPIAIVRGGVIFSQFFYSLPLVPATVDFIKWALWIHWMAPALTALALFLTDKHIRRNMLHVYSTDKKDKKEA